MLLSPEIAKPADSPRRCHMRGPRLPSPGPWEGITAGVLEHGIGTAGLPGNLRDPAYSFSLMSGVERPHPNAPGPRSASDLVGDTKTGAREGIGLQSLQTEWVETVVRESEDPIVPLKRGNPCAGTPWREGETGPRIRRWEPCPGLSA